MYSPSNSTHSLQCWMGLVNASLPGVGVAAAGYPSRPAWRDALRHWWIRGSESFRGSVEEFAQLLAKSQPGAVEPALHRRYRQIEGVGDVLVRVPIHVLVQRHSTVVDWLFLYRLFD